jgi:hypothetical protein
MHVTRTAPGTTARSGQALKVYELGDKVDRPYEIVGVVSATGNRGGVLSKAKKMIVAEAAALGAEAVVGYYYDDEKMASTDGWAGALAVKFLPSGAATPTPNKAVVAVPHAIIGDDFGKGKKAEKADAIARKIARFVLAKKGYYAVFVNDEISPAFPNGLKSLSAAERLGFGSPEADLVLAVTLGKRRALNILVIAGATQSVGAALYSKSGDCVTWQSRASGDSFDLTEIGVAWGISALIVPSGKTIEAIRIAMEKAFQSLPDVSQATTLK